MTRRAILGLVGARLWGEKLRGGFVFTEGPAIDRRGDLYFCDVGEERIYCLSKGSLRVVRNSSNVATGLAFDQRGRMVVCERGRVTRTEADGRLTILAESFEGKGLQSPNDVAVKGDGSIYFTDLKQKNEWANPAKTGRSAVYRWSEGDGLTLYADDSKAPNGIAISPREELVYVTDTAERVVRVYEAGSRGVRKGRVLATTSAAGGPDGVKTDRAGNVWVCEDEGLVEFSAAGARLRTVAIPEGPSNCVFSRDGSRVFVTAKTAVYEIELGLNYTI